MFENKNESPTNADITKIGIYGGTFDPIHIGHLSAALEITQCLNLDKVHFVPCHIPPHRTEPETSAAQRLAMVELAIAEEPRFIVDDRELKHSGASYSINTVEHLREQYGDQCTLYFFMGMDSLRNFNQWYRWQDFLSLCHIVVAARPGSQIPKQDTEIGDYVRQHRTESTADNSGGIIVLPTTPLDIAASNIRKKIQSGIEPKYLTPKPVLKYIKTNQLYGYGNPAHPH